MRAGAASAVGLFETDYRSGGQGRTPQIGELYKQGVWIESGHFFQFVSVDDYDGDYRGGGWTIADTSQEHYLGWINPNNPENIDLYSYLLGQYVWLLPGGNLRAVEIPLGPGDDDTRLSVVNGPHNYTMARLDVHEEDGTWTIHFNTISSRNLDGRLRPTGSKATAEPMIHAGIQGPGDDRGHIDAASLGGTGGNPINLVGQNFSVNRGEQMAYERQVLAYWTAHPDLLLSLSMIAPTDRNGRITNMTYLATFFRFEGFPRGITVVNNMPARFDNPPSRPWP